jgi:hypothetical protein
LRHRNGSDEAELSSVASRQTNSDGYWSLIICISLSFDSTSMRVLGVRLWRIESDVWLGDTDSSFVEYLWHLHGYHIGGPNFQYTTSAVGIMHELWYRLSIFRLVVVQIR